jgi:hypothetical protein
MVYFIRLHVRLPPCAAACALTQLGHHARLSFECASDIRTQRDPRVARSASAARCRTRARQSTTLPTTAAHAPSAASTNHLLTFARCRSSAQQAARSRRETSRVDGARVPGWLVLEDDWTETALSDSDIRSPRRIPNWGHAASCAIRQLRKERTRDFPSGRTQPMTSCQGERDLSRDSQPLKEGPSCRCRSTTIS